MVINQIVQGSIILIQIFLGSMSFYSLLNNAVTLGLTCMFLIYLVGFIELELIQVKRIKKKAGVEYAN